jgi:hypothetical protein
LETHNPAFGQKVINQLRLDYLIIPYYHKVLNFRIVGSSGAKLKS